MELLRALGALCERPEAGHQTVATAVGLDCPTPAQWHSTFVQRYYPYGSVYLGAEGFLGGDVRAAAAGVFSVVGATVPAEADHLTVLLDGLAEATQRGWTPVSATLLWEHLLPWTIPYLDRVAMDGAGPFRAWATLLTTALMSLAEQLDRPQTPLRVVTHHVGGLPDPRIDGNLDLVQAVLAPARLGAIVTRDDLLDAADDLVLAPRMGERRYLLRALLQQDPSGTLAWLADHALAAARRCDAWPTDVAHLAGWWRGRAQTSADLLGDLSRSAAALQGVT